MTELYTKIAAIGRKYGADKIILFGSRARAIIGSAAISILRSTAFPPTGRARFGPILTTSRPYWILTSYTSMIVPIGNWS